LNTVTSLKLGKMLPASTNESAMLGARNVYNKNNTVLKLLNCLLKLGFEFGNKFRFATKANLVRLSFTRARATVTNISEWTRSDQVSFTHNRIRPA
jgi:hypothetical protein